MNLQSTPARESFAPNSASAAWSWQPFLWCVRRELWENRSIYIAPLVAAGVALVAFLFALPHLPNSLRDFLAAHSADRHNALLLPFIMGAALILAVTFVVEFFYCLETLYGERRDRSILFWKSLPVSDLTTVLAKAVVPLVIIPLVGLAVCFATGWLMLLMSSAAVAVNGGHVAALWKLGLLHQWLLLLYHVLTMHALWYAPIYGWLLMISAWSPRAPLLWAVLPPLAIAGLEKIAFNTLYFAHFIQYLFIGGPNSGMQGTPLAFDPANFFGSPELWIGLAVGGLFIYVAARLRRYRGPV